MSKKTSLPEPKTPLGLLRPDTGRGGAKPKTPALEIKSGIDARTLRRKRNLNQLEFWSLLGVTQSGGSRYESGRSMPFSTLVLLNLIYGKAATVKKLMLYLRGND